MSIVLQCNLKLSSGAVLSVNIHLWSQDLHHIVLYTTISHNYDAHCIHPCQCIYTYYIQLAIVCIDSRLILNALTSVGT